MRLGRQSASLVLAVVGALLVAGCGGGSSGNGIDKLSANDALAKVKAATADVSSVHVKGTITQSGRSLAIDISVGPTEAQGKVGIGGGTMDLRFTHGVTYFRGDSKIFAALGANAAQASLASGRWIKDSSSSGPASAFAGFFDRKKLFEELLKPQGSIKTGGSTTVNGEKALILVQNAAGGGKLYVAETGDALPLRVEPSGNTGGRIDFLDYNADVNVDAPSGALDISQLGGG